jgi:hypothetical protein
MTLLSAAALWHVNKGKLKQTASVTSVDVLYAFIDLALDDVRGRIWIEDNPTPAAQFVANLAWVSQPDSNFVLETASGVEVWVSFTDADGAFRCQAPSEARAALVLRGELGPMPGEVISMVHHSSFPALRSGKGDLH